MPYNYFGYNANQYMPTNYNPYMQAQQRTQEQYQPMQYNRQPSLQGKTVDNIEVVKAIDIPLDGSVSYFPLADGTAIVSKRIKDDGSSEIAIYKLSKEKEIDVKYITVDEFQNALRELNINEIDDIKEDIKEIKKKLKKEGNNL